jgi:hypothetical protein
MIINEKSWRYCGESEGSGYFVAGNIIEFDFSLLSGIKLTSDWKKTYCDTRVAVFRNKWTTLMIHSDGQYTVSRAPSKRTARNYIRVIASELDRAGSRPRG